MSFRLPRRLPCTLLITTMLLIAGCGGGGGGSQPTETTTPVRMALNWPLRSRAVNAPASSLSAVFTLTGARSGGSDFVWVVNRGAQAAAYEQNVVTSDRARPGQWNFTARFFAERDGQGALVAQATMPVILAADGTGIPDLTPTGTVAQVEVTPDQSLAVGETRDLQFIARDSSGAVLALTPGAAFFTITNGAGLLQITPQGQGAGTLPGQAQVVATVDGVVSVPQNIRVTSSATVTVQPETITVAAGGITPLIANVTNAPDTSILWTVLEGNVGGTITPNGVYTAPATAGVYHAVATSGYDAEKSAQVTITVTVAVSVTPAQATLSVGDTAAFKATVLGASDTSVQWSVQEGANGGTITPTGVYTASATAGVYHIVATSAADPTRTAVATVTVQSGSATGVIQ